MTDQGSKQKQLRIAVDAMGGDYAPEETVKGSVQAAKDFGLDIIFTGQTKDVESALAKVDVGGVEVRVVEASEIIEEGEQPAIAVMRKPNSSVAVAAKLVKSGEADAMLSAGPTGACMVAGLQYIGALPGIERPMAGGTFVGLAPQTVILDLGANIGSKPEHLVNFAVAGSVYVSTFLGIENPTVGLLNVGSEEGKGNDLVKEAYPLLKESGLNFVGNVEGMDIPAGKVNVVVCDGFVGNIILKFTEGLGERLTRWLAEELKGKLSKDDEDELRKKLARTMGAAMEVGGGPLWGIDGVVAVAHGASKARQITGTIEQIKVAIETGFVDKLRKELERVQA